MDELKIMTKRLERLERQNSRFKIAGILILLASFTFVLMGQIPVNQEVRAQKFSLYDARGKNRAMLFSRDGQAILVLAAPTGEPRITLVVAADGTPALGLNDKNGDDPRIALAVAADGTPTLGLNDKDGKIRAKLSLLNNAPALSLYSKEDSKPRVLLNLGSDGAPRLGFTDKNQLPRIAVGAAGEEWGVAVWDSKGKLVGSVGDKK